MDLDLAPALRNQHVLAERRDLLVAVDAGCVTAVARERSQHNKTEGHARWIDMLTRFTPRRIALVVIAGLAVLTAFCVHGWSSNRARPGEPARSS